MFQKISLVHYFPTFFYEFLPFSLGQQGEGEGGGGGGGRGRGRGRRRRIYSKTF